MSKKTTKKHLKLRVISGEVFGISTYRGSGLLSEVALMSSADVFDQKTNPTGTQRDLNPAHAKAAHAYVLNQGQPFWPEVVLCCRRPEVLTFEPRDAQTGAGFLSVDIRQIDKLRRQGLIAVSRLDGNHRLHLADGKTEGYVPIHKTASFCILVGLDLQDEIRLFRDINNNQRRMSTSHLDNITIRLTEEERLQKENPSLYVAKRLGDDPQSPFYGLVHEGGKKTPEMLIPLRALHTGINYLRSKSTKLGEVGDIEAEYVLIRTYWNAVREWQPEAWKKPKEYLLLRGSGLWAGCFLGGTIIDRCLEQGKYQMADMLKILKSGPAWDWGKNGPFRGLAGRGGSVEIANRISKQLPTKSGISIAKLIDKIKAG